MTEHPYPEGARPARAGRQWPFAVLGLLFAVAATAASAEIEVEDAWSRATPPGVDRGAGYMTLRNTGDEERVLTGAETDRAKRTEIHESREVDGRMQMKPLPDGLTLEPGETVELKPMGIHLMLMGLEKALAEGDNVPVTLTFRDGETLDTELSVRSPGDGAE